MAQADANVDGVVATAGYVKGAYNAAIKAINKVATTADSAVKTVAEGVTNGTIAVDGTDVAVHGLGSAAYTNSNAYATAAQGAKADTAVQSVTEGSTNGTGSVDGTDVAVHGLGSAAYANTTAFDAAGAAAAVENKLDDGATGYDINAKSLKVQGEDVLTNAALTTYATKTGVEKTAAAAVNGATIDLSGIQATTAQLTGTVPVVDTWGATAPAANPVSVTLSQGTVVTGLTGNTANVTNKISAGTISYTEQ